MYHIRLKGKHYDIGFKWGSTLLKNGIQLLEIVPFEISSERIHYAEACLPFFEEFFPDILKEIQGIAEGQKCDVKRLQAVLFSMYCIMPKEVHCSCFAIRNEKGVWLGRNSDFLVEIEKYTLNCLYDFNHDSYAFSGNTTAFVEMEDGINEKGLAVGLTSIYPHRIQPGLNAGMVLRYLLEKCASVQEVIQKIKTLPLGCSMTFCVADKSGSLALIEANCEKVEIQSSSNGKSDYVLSVNRFHLPTMYPYRMECDDWYAERRYQTMDHALRNELETFDLTSVEQLLSGKKGFLCQYDRETGKDTVWSCIYDLSNLEIYRTEGNPKNKKFKNDKRFLIKK